MNGRPRSVPIRQRHIRSWISLQHFDVAGATCLANDLGAKMVWTRQNSIDSTNGRSVFGGRSLVGDGVSMHATALAVAPSWNSAGTYFGVNDWTLDFWAQKDSGDAEPIFACHFDDNNYYILGLNTSDELFFYAVKGGAVVADYLMYPATYGFVAGTWQRYMVCRSGADLFVAVGSAAADMQPYAWDIINVPLTAAVDLTMNAAEIYYLFALPLAAPVYASGDSFMDEFRIINGQAIRRDSMAALTPWTTPAAAFSVDQVGSPNDNYNQSN